MNYRRGKIIEFIFLLLLVPTIVIIYRLASFLFLFLWIASLYCYFILRFQYHARLQEMWNWRAVNWQNLKPVLLRWMFASLALYFFLSWYEPEKLFYILQRNPYLLAFLFFAYPVVSALPQEYIFCSFFMRRYQSFFKNDNLRCLMSALVFGYAHCLFINPIAPPLSFIGGWIFAKTFIKTKSLALVTIEHGLYGNSLFLIGVGWYFYGGNVPAA